MTLWTMHDADNVGQEPVDEAYPLRSHPLYAAAGCDPRVARQEAARKVPCRQHLTGGPSGQSARGGTAAAATGASNCLRSGGGDSSY